MYNDKTITEVKKSLKFKVVINSFSSSVYENGKSNEILHYLDSRRLSYETVDINQEMNLTRKEDSKKKNIRERYFIDGNLAYINNELCVPQLWLNKLRLNYEQFIFLIETKLLDSIVAGDACEHVRFFQSAGEALELVHFREKYTHCVYCISERKLKPKAELFCDFRNSKDEETNQILSFLEVNLIYV